MTIHQLVVKAKMVAEKENLLQKMKVAELTEVAPTVNQTKQKAKEWNSKSKFKESASDGEYKYVSKCHCGNYFI